MSYNVSIVADSVNDAGDRITTYELTYPRFVHAQFMTHRLFSRNASSSRAIPTKRLLAKIEYDPVMPLEWGQNQRGMQATEVLSEDDAIVAEDLWIAARDAALYYARQLDELGVHKQIVNRLVEPWMYITVLCTATEYDNWWHLRGEDAQPEIAWVASQMKELAKASTPVYMPVGAWHLPLVEQVDKNSPLYISHEEKQELGRETGDPWIVPKICVARCARVSYLTHDGERDLRKDLELFDRLATSGHWSPFEHAASACSTSIRWGNFFGWKQYRKYFASEHQGRRLGC